MKETISTRIKQEQEKGTWEDGVVLSRKNLEGVRGSSMTETLRRGFGAWNQDWPISHAASHRWGRRVRGPKRARSMLVQGKSRAHFLPHLRGHGRRALTASFPPSVKPLLSQTEKTITTTTESLHTLTAPPAVHRRQPYSPPTTGPDTETWQTPAVCGATSHSCILERAPRDSTTPRPSAQSTPTSPRHPSPEEASPRGLPVVHTYPKIHSNTRHCCGIHI